MSVCAECKRELQEGEERFMYGKKLVCGACMEKLSEQGNMCPNCGTMLPSDREEIGIVLPLSKTCEAHKQMTKDGIMEPEALMLVCPKCHVLFMDKFQYEVLKGLIEEDPSENVLKH